MQLFKQTDTKINETRIILRNIYYFLPSKNGISLEVGFKKQNRTSEKIKKIIEEESLQFGPTSARVASEMGYSF